MNFEDAQKIWSQQSVPSAQNSAADAALLARIREDAARFERNYRRKDWLDIVIVLLACVTMAWIAQIHASPFRVLSALALLPIPACLLVFRWKDRRAHTPLGDNLTLAIANALVRLRHRRDLMRLYIWICIGSLLCAKVLSQIHRQIHTPSPEQPQQWILQTAFFLAVATLMFLGSRLQISTKIDPQIADLEAQQRALLSAEKPDA